MKLRGVYQVAYWRKNMIENPMFAFNIRMSICIYKIKDDQIEHDDKPMIISGNKIRK